jgi:hypothetical protein
MKSGGAASDDDEGEKRAVTMMSATTRATMRATIEREDKQGLGQIFETKQTQQPTTTMTLQEGGMRHLGCGEWGEQGLLHHINNVYNIYIKI